jgi:hypothetical protein
MESSKAQKLWFLLNKIDRADQSELNHDKLLYPYFYLLHWNERYSVLKQQKIALQSSQRKQFFQSIYDISAEQVELAETMPAEEIKALQDSLIDQFILKLTQQAPGINPDNISFNTFYQFQRIGNDANAILRISGKPLTKYGQPCDVAAFPYEYDRMYFRTFVYSGPATTADFIVADNCNIVANAEITQRASYPAGTYKEIEQLEKNFYSYQAGYLKHLYRMAGYNQNFESWVAEGATYDTYYIKFNDYDRSAYQWGDYIMQDSMVIVAINKADTSLVSAFETALSTALGNPAGGNTCVTTTSTSTTTWPSTTTTSTLIP